MKRIFKAVLGLSFIVYLFVLIFILFLKSRGVLWSNVSMIDYLKISTNLIPFRTILTYIRAIGDGSMNVDIPVKNLLGNLGLFFPMGLFLPMLFTRITPKKFSWYMIVLLFSIESLQLITRRGSFDIDDFLLNFLGAWIGFILYRSFLAYIPARDQKMDGPSA